MVGDKIGADQNPFLTDIFQKIAVGCFPSCRGSLSTLIHTADRSNASHSGMTIGRDGSRVQSRSEFENRRHFVQAEDERTAEMWKEEMARECPLVGLQSGTVYRTSFVSSLPPVHPRTGGPLSLTCGGNITWGNGSHKAYCHRGRENRRARSSPSTQSRVGQAGPRSRCPHWQLRHREAALLAQVSCMKRRRYCRSRRSQVHR